MLNLTFTVVSEVINFHRAPNLAGRLSIGDYKHSLLSEILSWVTKYLLIITLNINIVDSVLLISLIPRLVYSYAKNYGKASGIFNEFTSDFWNIFLISKKCFLISIDFISTWRDFSDFWVHILISDFIYWFLISQLISSRGVRDFTRCRTPRIIWHTGLTS